MEIKILILAAYFPKPFNKIMGVWALQQAVAFKKIGIEPIVISPTPYIPKIMGLFNKKLHDWSNIVSYSVIDGIQIYYPKMFVYPQLKKIYDNVPFFEFYFYHKPIQKILDKVISNEKIDLLYCHHPLIEGYVGLLLKKRYKLPLVTVEHSLTDISRALNNKRRKQCYEKVLNNCDLAIAVSTKVKQEMQKFKSDQDIKVILNGAELHDNFHTSKSESNIQTIKIVSVGSLIEQKGHLYLIKAINELKKKGLKNIECKIIGDGPLKNTLQQLIVKLKLSNSVHLVGQIPHKEVIKIMRDSDIFVLPSWGESFATVCTEALKCGLAVVTTKDEGYCDVIVNHENGVLVEKRNYKELAEELMFLIKNPVRRRQIASKGYESAKSLTWENNVMKIKHCFEEIIK